jgi:hypothetical protein
MENPQRDGIARKELTELFLVGGHHSLRNSAMNGGQFDPVVINMMASFTCRLFTDMTFGLLPLADMRVCFRRG